MTWIPWRTIWCLPWKLGLTRNGIFDVVTPGKVTKTLKPLYSFLESITICRPLDLPHPLTFRSGLTRNLFSFLKNSLEVDKFLKYEYTFILTYLPSKPCSKLFMVKQSPSSLKVGWISLQYESPLPFEFFSSWPSSIPSSDP